MQWWLNLSTPSPVGEKTVKTGYLAQNKKSRSRIGIWDPEANADAKQTKELKFFQKIELKVK